MFSFASRTLCGNSIIELSITDNEIFDDAYNGAASANKHKETSEKPSTLRLLYFDPCITSFFSLLIKQS